MVAYRMEVIKEDFQKYVGVLYAEYGDGKYVELYRTRPRKTNESAISAVNEFAVSKELNPRRWGITRCTAYRRKKMVAEEEEELPDFTDIGKIKKIIEGDKLEADALKKRIELGEIKPMKAKTKKINPEKMVDRARKYING